MEYFSILQSLAQNREMDSKLIASFKEFLYQWIQPQISAKSLVWLEQKQQQYEQDPQAKNFYLTFASIPRFIEKKILSLSESQLSEADALRKGFQPAQWSSDRAVRVFWLLYLPMENPTDLQTILNQLFETADVNELVALYSALPLLPYPNLHIHRCTEGVRTNMTDVFEAVALHNPYPADYLDDNAWNQLFLKAIFTNRAIYQIYRIEERANAELARMCLDFAQERWAAGREVTPEIWRPVGNFLTPQMIEALTKVWNEPHILQKQAAYLALAKTDTTHLISKDWIHEFGEISWDEIGRRWQNR